MLHSEDFSTGLLNPESPKMMIKNSRMKSRSLKKFNCQKCSYMAKCESLLQTHIKTQHNPLRKIYSCHLCDYFCMQERTFHLHQLRHSDQGAKFACDQCGKLFLSMGIMKRHALTHNKLKSFICHVEGCGKGFNIKSRLTDHVRYVHNNKSISHNKSHCGNKSSHADNGLVLEATSSKEGEQFVNSERKGKKVSRKLNRELKLPKDAGFISCGTLEDYEKHQSQHIRNQTDFDVINVYDVVLPDNNGNTKSRNDLSKTCTTSNEFTTLVSKPTSITSMSIIQSISPSFVKMEQFSKKCQFNRTSKFTCSWIGCGKSFRDGFNLRMHTYTHTGEMQRACKLCGYTCVQKSALDKHMKVHEMDVIV